MNRFLRMGVLFVTVIAVAQEPLPSARPLSKCDVLLYQLFGAEGEEHLRHAIQNQGIGFDSSEAFLADLKKTGASEAFISDLSHARHSDDAPAFACDKSFYSQVLKTVIHAVQKPYQDEEEWQALLKVQRRNPMLHLALGLTFSKRRNSVRATDEAQTAVRLDPELAEAHAQLAAAFMVRIYPQMTLDPSRYIIRGSPDPNFLKLAASEYQEALRIERGNCHVRTNYSIVLIIQRDFTAAGKELQAAKEQCPALAFVRYIHANLFSEQGRRDEAITELRAGLALQPGNPVMLDYLGSLLLKGGDENGALEAYRAAVKARPEDAVSHVGMGQVFERQGKLNEALEEYKKALSLMPGAPDLQANLDRVRSRLH